MDSHQHDQRTRWPRESHGSLDRHSNDRLGWIRRPQPLKHWREILRCCTESDTYIDSHGHTHSYPNADAYGDAHASIANSEWHTDAYGNGVTESYSHAPACTDTAAAQHPGTTTLAGGWRVVSDE